MALSKGNLRWRWSAALGVKPLFVRDVADADPSPTHHRLVSPAELAARDGRGDSIPDSEIWLSILGEVYDVSSGARFYGPEGATAASPDATPPAPSTPANSTTRDSSRTSTASRTTRAWRSRSGRDSTDLPNSIPASACSRRASSTTPRARPPPPNAPSTTPWRGRNANARPSKRERACFPLARRGGRRRKGERCGARTEERTPGKTCRSRRGKEGCGARVSRTRPSPTRGSYTRDARTQPPGVRRGRRFAFCEDRYRSSRRRGVVYRENRRVKREAREESSRAPRTPSGGMKSKCYGGLKWTTRESDTLRGQLLQGGRARAADEATAPSVVRRELRQVFFWFLGFFSEAHSTVAHAVMASMASSPSPSIFSLAM